MSRRRRRNIRDSGEPIETTPGMRRCVRGDNRGRTFDRKTAQLCRQVANTLHYVLHGDGTNELLSSLSVVSVEPAPDSSRLMVVVSSDLELGNFGRAQILELLERQVARLRCEVAQSIHRRKTPQLYFHLAISPDGDKQ